MQEKILDHSHSAAWQERVREDADWLHNRIWNDRNEINSRQQEEKSYRREIRGALHGGVVGIVIGAGLAALESLANKEPVRFMRLASYAGGIGMGLALVNAWLVLSERDITRRKSYDIKIMNDIRNILSDTYGEDALKGQHQWYDWYKKIENDQILNNDRSSKSR